LLGSKEDNITYSVGWALAHAPTFRANFAQVMGAGPKAFDEVWMQQYGKDKGFTDIELLGPDAHAIVEAKRGWWLPGDLQFQKYAPRFEEQSRASQTFVAMSDCSSTYAKLHLPPTIANVPLRYFGWRDVEALAATGQSHAEKRLLADLRTYLRTVATMQDPRSNMVFVVSLGAGFPEGSSVSWIEIVEKRRQYFHPVGNRWPKEPPNYVAFRYGGRLQSIHHVESFVVTKNIGQEVEGYPKSETIPHFVYRLGPPIRPEKEVKNGPSVRQSARVKVMLDLLLTCDTITEAWKKTNERLNHQEDPE
jgi:hypothetical protein